MANPDSPYLTQQWSGQPHYVCPRCGYNTFDPTFLDHHRCLPMPGREDTPPAATAEVAPGMPPAESEG